MHWKRPETAILSVQRHTDVLHVVTSMPRLSSSFLSINYHKYGVSRTRIPSLCCIQRWSGTVVMPVSFSYLFQTWW